MTIIPLLRIFGAGYVERELALLIKRHVTATGFAAMGDKFAVGAQGCKDGSADAVAQAITDLLFSIH